MRNDTDYGGRPRGRPRSFNEEEVLDRLKEVFHDKGFSAASLDDLAAASGLNRPSLYAAFGNKEKLYIHVIRRMSAQSVAGIDQALNRPGPVRDHLARLYRHMIKVYTAPPARGCMIVGTATAEAPRHPAIAAAAAVFIRNNEQALERHLAAAVERGELAAVPLPAVRARLATALFDTLAVRARLGSPAEELQTFADLTVPLICGACPEADPA